MAETTECKHCGMTGTCRTGSNGEACQACIEIHEFRGNITSPMGLWCGVCKGSGLAEPFSSKLQNRVAPFVAIVIVLCTLIVAAILAFKEQPLRAQVLTLVGTLGGSVAGYYFGGKHSA